MRSSFPFVKFAATTSVLASVVMLTGCMFAPGMHYSDGDPVDVNSPESVPVTVPITFNLIQRDKFNLEKASHKTEPYQALVGVAPAYTVGPADILSIIVWDHPELVLPTLTFNATPTSGSAQSGLGSGSQTISGYPVDERGAVQFPYINSVEVAGLTEKQIQSKVTARLSKYFNDPQVTVRVVGFLSRKIYIDGEVRTPGAKPMTTVPMTLAEAIGEANGLTSLGDQTNIQLFRDGKTYNLSLVELASAGLTASQIPLRNNDSIRVMPLLDNRVFVMGEVNKPAAVPFRTNGRLSLSDALADSGGVSPITSDPSKIYVIRPVPGGDLPIVFHLDSKSPVAMALAQGFQLQPQDLVYVDAPMVVRWNRVITQLIGSTTSAYYIQRAAQNN